MASKSSNRYPPMGDFMRMPAGTFVYYEVDDFSEMTSMNSTSHASGGKIKVKAVAGMGTKNLDVQKLVRCEVVVPVPPRKKRGPRAGDSK